MSDRWNPNEASDEEDEPEGGSIRFTGRNGLIFLVDAHEDLTGTRDTFESCLECIEAVMLNRIISSAKDLIGVVFYNTEHSAADKTSDQHIVVPSNTAILLPMQVISKSSIGYVKNMKASSDFHDFANRYGSSDANSNSFCEALWLCSRMLVNADYKLQSSTIVLFTNNEQPHPEGSSELHKTFIRAKDLNAMNVDIMLVPMVDDFDDNKFFRELICTVSDLDLDTYRPVNPLDQRLNLCRRMFRRDMQRSCLRYFNWTLGDGLEIGCGLHSFTKTAMKPRSVHLLAATNEIVESKRVYKTRDEATGDERRLLPGELRKFQILGGKKVFLTPEELATAKTIMAPGMKLLGFKPMSQLQPRWFVKPSRLLYPDDKQVKGSTKLFRTVWERCLANQVFAVCVFVQIRKVEPRYVALVPQTEEQDGSDGFRIVYLPMQTDSRSLAIYEREVPELTEEASVKMQALVKKLKFKYDPTIFRDPHLEVFYADLEALVFEESQVDCEDATMPSVTDQDSRIGVFVEALTQMFGEDCSVKPKRTATSKLASDTASKKPRVDSVLSRDDIFSAISSGAIEKLSVSALKDFLQSQNEKGLSKLKKTELIERAKQICLL